ncbi:MAG: DUF2442 domain-containing protein [Nitrospirae bacterium]|nr:DUF2442 domain-containing protein [Nitrospirota bacterium]
MAVEPLVGYHIRIKFSDGLEGVVNLSGLAGKGVFKAWNDPEHFRSVFVDPESHTIAWPWDIDLCPDSLYAELRLSGG